MRRYFFCIYIIFIASFIALGDDNVELGWGDCLSYAQKSNPELISARTIIDQAYADKDIARSSLLPDIAASLVYSRSVSGGLQNGHITDNHSYALTASQLIFDGLKAQNNLTAAKENIQYSSHEYGFASAKVRLNLRSAFIALLKAQAMIATAGEILALRREEADLIKLRYDSGLEHKGALLRAQANLAQGETESAQAKRNLRFCQRQLAVRIGWSDFKALKVNGDFNSADDDQTMPDFDALVKNNPQYLAALAKKNINEYDLHASYGEFAPEIKATADIGKSSATWPPQNAGWGVGVNLSMPLFEGGLNKAKVDKALSSRAQALADVDSTYNALVMALEQYWAGMCDAREAVSVKEKVLLACNERYEIGKAQYSTGFIDFDSWIIIEDDLVNAKKAYLNAQADALYAQANWVYAKGGVLEYAN